MGWRGYIHDPSETVFFWSQKAACTTLFNVLADNMDPRPAAKNHFHRNSVPYMKCIAAIQERGFRAAILVRHPVTRCISAYFNKFCLYRDKPLKRRSDLEPFAQDLHDLYCDRTGADREINGMSFEAFLETVAAAFAQRPKPHLPVNGHWDTQFPAFMAKDGFRYDHVLRVETFDTDMADLAPRIGLRFTPRQLNKTALPKTRYPGYLGQVPGHQVADYAFGYQNFISPQNLEKIRDLYQVDFDLFDYPLMPPLA
jgi:hypothetical protein